MLTLSERNYYIAHGDTVALWSGAPESMRCVASRPCILFATRLQASVHNGSLRMVQVTLQLSDSASVTRRCHNTVEEKHRNFTPATNWAYRASEVVEKHK